MAEPVVLKQQRGDLDRSQRKSPRLIQSNFRFSSCLGFDGRLHGQEVRGGRVEVGQYLTGDSSGAGLYPASASMAVPTDRKSEGVGPGLDVTWSRSVS